MSKFDEAVSSYTDALSSIGVKVNATVLTGVAKGLGPSIYLKDASLVSCTDQVELDRVKNNFLIGKLGLADGPEARKALRAQLLLDALVEKEEVQVGQRELVEYLVQASQQYGMDPNEFMKAVGESAQVPPMVAEVARRKALAVVLSKAAVTDASGNAIDLGSLFNADEDEDGEGEGEDADQPLPVEPVGASAGDPSAVSISDIGGFVPDEPVAQ